MDRFSSLVSRLQMAMLDYRVYTSETRTIAGFAGGGNDLKC